MNSTSTHTEPYANGLAKDAASISGKAGTVMSNASSELHNFIADIEDLVKEATTLTGEDLLKVKAKLNDRLSEAKEAASDMSGAIAKRTRQAANTTNDYVHEQPWKAIGAGAAAGLLVGFLIARR